eukprot:827762-Rhodomonas_salina.3
MSVLQREQKVLPRTHVSQNRYGRCQRAHDKCAKACGSDRDQSDSVSCPASAVEHEDRRSILHRLREH